MPNTFLTPSIIAKEALMVLLSNLTMANLVHRDYSDEYAKVKLKQLPVKTIDWEQDEGLIFPEINRAAGGEVRALDYLHWWTFLGYFSSMGECLYSQVLNIRQKRAKGKKLEKWEQEFFRSHKELIVIREKLTAEEQAELDAEEVFVDSLC